MEDYLGVQLGMFTSVVGGEQWAKVPGYQSTGPPRAAAWQRNGLVGDVVSHP